MQGGRFTSWFDISGHVFLMVYCALTMSSEVGGFARNFDCFQSVSKLFGSSAVVNGPTANTSSDQSTPKIYNVDYQEDPDNTEVHNRVRDVGASSTKKENLLQTSNDFVMVQDNELETRLEKEVENDLCVEDNDISTKPTYIYSVLRPIALLSYFFIIFLCILCDISLVITCLYYHSFIEKFIAVMLAIGSWYCQYGILFKKWQLL